MQGSQLSWREHWSGVKSSAVSGDVISGCRDNDTQTYRLFVTKGWRDGFPGHWFESCACCDLSIEDLRELVKVLEKIVAEHRPWPNCAEGD